ncbi:legume-like lectin [Trypanosoma theileri]|uniref:Legume-like lectin n=1 Tax=Trypanosoma theileri TaxID=67003 RepID=A0A1X0NLJ5_9TRYP|nr:legume-like lectin [Trypanosoma theileri]ORC85576.1 legume-like lectin [Trypanosoma theileri]
MLQNYWENGMRFWTFGLNTVVTDNYVRLTESAPNAKGYLWNRHSNHMEAFELNVTLQMRKRSSPMFSGTKEGGMGIWYTTAENFSSSADTRLFGFARRFFGIGVLLSHSDEISLLASNGDIDFDVESIQQQRHGYCRVPALGELHLTITIRYNSNSMDVLYVYHPNDEPQPSDYVRAIFCASTPAPPLNGSYTFGVTAANSATAQATHEIHSVIMTPLSDKEHHADEEKKAGQVHLFTMDEKEANQELLGNMASKEGVRS